MEADFLTPAADSVDAAVRLAVAALIGLAVGIERQWSGHASGPEARFAGMRTFLILGIIGGTAGLLGSAGQPLIAAVLLTGIIAASVAAFVVVHRRTNVEVDGTTEAAAIAVGGLGVLAGGGLATLAAGAAAVIVFALGEKERLHGLVARVAEAELRAGARFAVMALVILPLLPDTPLGWLGGISIRQLWMLVLVFSAVNFFGYLAQKAVGADRGYGIAGLLGGLVSSTAVALQFSRRSRSEPRHSVAMARGTVAACTVVPLRLLVIAAAVSPEVALASLRFLIGPAVVGAGVLFTGLIRREPPDGGEAETSSPLNLASSIKMAAFFALALAVVGWVGSNADSSGVLASAALLGLSDTDALTVSMARFGAGGPVELAARAIAVGLLSNTGFKLALSLAFGTATFRRHAAAGLVLMAAAIGAGFLI